jgi:hypothetical protein
MPRAVKRASVVGSVATTLVYVLLAAGGELRLMHTRYTSDFYDVQARRIFHGHLTVPLDRFGLEAFVVNGHTHTYFGLLPSLLRMPILLVTSRFDGRLTQLSMLGAFVLLLWASCRLAWQLRNLLRADAPVSRRDVALAATAPVVAGASSVALYLGASPVVYHEAILWGIATGVAATTLLVDHVRAPSTRTAVWLAVAVAATLFARASIGFGVVATVGVVLGAVALRRWLGERGVARRIAAFGGSDGIAPTTGNVLALALVIVVPMVLYVAVNEARFHRALGPPYKQQVWTELSAERRAALDANGGSLFNVGYAPSTAWAYLRPDGLSGTRLFPFVDFRAPRATVIGDVVFDTRDRTSSVPSSMPAATALGVVGAWAVVDRRTRTQLAILRPVVVGGVVAVLGVLTIGFIAQRYLGDFLLLLVPLALAGAVVAVDAICSLSSRRVRNALFALGAVVIAWSIWVNLGLGLVVQRAYWAPDDRTRHEFLTFQRKLDERLFGDTAFARGPTRPADDDGTRGELFVVGECEQLLWHDSWVWVDVEPLPDGTTPLCLRLLD